MFDIWLSCVKVKWLFCPPRILRNQLCSQIHCPSTQEMFEHSPGCDFWLPSNPGPCPCQQYLCGRGAVHVLAVCWMSSCPAGLWGLASCRGPAGTLAPKLIALLSWVCQKSSEEQCCNGLLLLSQVKLHVQRASALLL